MLKRLYVHNYKCLVNFEINFDQDVSLFLGANGAGKSTIFEVLHKLRRVINYQRDLDTKSRDIVNGKIEDLFDYNDKPRWLNSETIDTRFELEIEIQNCTYKYSLVIFLGTSPVNNISPIPIIKEELLSCNNHTLVKSNPEKTLFFWDNNDKPSEIEFNETTSCIREYCSITATEFYEYFRNVILVRINPYSMAYSFVHRVTDLSMIEQQKFIIESDLSNLAEWVTLVNEENRSGVSEFERMMRDIIPGYENFTIKTFKATKVLFVNFKNPSNERKPITYDFGELSEGQKLLFALYALLFCTPENSLICIDEPENFLALPEIQPWFDTLYDQCAERNLQAILISHHPKIINLLASESGYWFSRENNLTRIQKITPEDESGLSIAELIERGWIYEH